MLLDGWFGCHSNDVFVVIHYITSFWRYPSQEHRYGINHHLTHWGRVTHICVGKLTIIGSDNDLSPGRRQAIIRTSAGILLIEPLGTNISEISIGIQIFSFKKMRLKMASAKWRPFCLGLNVLTMILHDDIAWAMTPPDHLPYLCQPCNIQM